MQKNILKRTLSEVVMIVALAFIGANALASDSASMEKTKFSDLVMTDCRLNSLNYSPFSMFKEAELVGATVTATKWPEVTGFSVKGVVQGGLLILKLRDGRTISLFPYSLLKSVQSYPFYERFESTDGPNEESWVSLEIFEVKGITTADPRRSIAPSYEVVLRMANMYPAESSTGEPVQMEIRPSVQVITFNCPKAP